MDSLSGVGALFSLNDSAVEGDKDTSNSLNTSSNNVFSNSISHISHHEEEDNEVAEPFPEEFWSAAFCRDLQSKQQVGQPTQEVTYPSKPTLESLIRKMAVTEESTNSTIPSIIDLKMVPLGKRVTSESTCISSSVEPTTSTAFHQSKRENKAQTKSSFKQLNDESKRLLVSAEILAQKFNGECLTKPCHISIVKGIESIKFKCEHGHVFYKPKCDFDPIPPRRFSMSTAASDSSADDDDQQNNWCPKCVVFYKSCAKTAGLNGLSIVGKCYGKLAFKCHSNGHLTKISYSRRLSDQPFNCHHCLR